MQTFETLIRRHSLPVFLLKDARHKSVNHYENMPIQIYTENFTTKKWKFNFQIKIRIYFHISAQNIDCGYSLEPPRRRF